MKKKLTFQFDPNQSFQLNAISNVVDIFEGIPFQEQQDMLSGTSEDIISNFHSDEVLDEYLLLDNLQFVQQRNNDEKRGSELELADDLFVDDGMVLENTGYDSVRTPHFTIEMETGTGKTYVYLRTVHELKQKYGFTKFVIVVPSIAIYEGVIKSIEVTKGHFKQLYDNQEITYIPYDSNKLSEFHNFATNTDLTVMIITIDAFNKASNNIYKDTEKLPGERKPYEYIQQTRPIIILDEAQNFETEKSREAIRTLKPLFVLRYSATHRETPNLVYRLTPIDAFRNNLVKQIEVIGISELGRSNDKVLRLVEITKKPITAKVRASLYENGQLIEKDVILKQDDNLFDKTNNPDYKGFKVAEIRNGRKPEEQFITFENNITLSALDSMLSKEIIFRTQIERTIATHFERQKELKSQGIKVLSLFFIDRVKNYTASDGLIKRLFDESFEKLKHQYNEFKGLSAPKVRQGYFAKPKIGASDEDAIDTNGSNQKQKKMEKQAFELIMKEKERLLSFDEPVSFIFAHSALKEGWDNPNVFQICTLNQTTSAIKKRQEIGRGLRLAVNQEGTRVENHGINVLTVVANEAYENFVSELQREYIEDGLQAPPAPKKPEQGKAKRNNELFNSKEFQGFWRKLNKKLKYKLSIDTNKLINDCVSRLNNVSFPSPLVEISRGSFIMAEYKIGLLDVENSRARLEIQVNDTSGNTQNDIIYVEEKDDLRKILKNERLRGFKILRIAEQYGEWYVKFTNEITVKKYEPYMFKAERVTKPQKRVIQNEKKTYPIPDFVTRVANETSLTRETIIEIFKRMNFSQKEQIFYNPEGWISEFLTQIRITLSDHVVENIEFEAVDNNEIINLNNLFPETVRTPQRELIESGKSGLYDKVQIDSEVEKRFVENLIIPDSDDGNVVLYFKFPPKFKINLPKVIGNYNPDWGIVRQSKCGKLNLDLVRETKGAVNLDELRFPQEKRKILCAKKYFEKLGVSYRVVTDESYDWWEEEAEQLKLEDQNILKIEINNS
ncbi:DEAD/DEAH box helicase family protein [Priestia megaterium]|uniref:restriction endonuclease n=1 Tax=Priestia megaterium TaxID=1404 RepID=UPI0011BB4460|nr:DEAD/DEAH box helicase family protein [Priestia megaterium]QDZ80159.1 type III restriction endonuclease subunit R [Priestia megaterium]